MVSSVDQVKTVLEKKACYTHRSKEEGAYHAKGGHMKKQQGQSRGRGSERQMWTRALIVVYKGRNG